MSPVGWEPQAVDSIASALGGSDPGVAALRTTFSRLVTSEEMPAHEKERSPLRHPPYRRWPHPRRDKTPHRRCGPQQAAVLIWLLTSITLITLAVIASRG